MQMHRGVGLSIFGVADYGIVGDMDTVCDMMIEALKNR